MKRENHDNLPTRGKHFINPLTDKRAIKEAFESSKNLSEHRWDRLDFARSVQLAWPAIEQFRREAHLVVTVSVNPSGIPSVPRDAGFKYSHAGRQGSLAACSQRMTRGEALAVVTVRQAGRLIGYGITAKKSRGSEIEIIDVAVHSRRRAGLARDFTVGEDIFQVGVGHVVASVLIQNCGRPVRVDATTESSRYIFKSLGFLHDNELNNSCILELR